MCMSHNERMLNGPGGLDFDRPAGNLIFRSVRSDTPNTVLMYEIRNSDDFNLPYDECHPDFIQYNTYQTILTSHLSLTLDYDMFASNPAENWPKYHALLRCLSPGPLLLSDTPETITDRIILKKMTAKSRSGTLEAVKTETAAQALPCRWFWDNLQGHEDGPGMLGYVNFPAASGAIIGAWNCRKTSGSASARDTIRQQDVEDALEIDELQDDYALWIAGHSRMNDSRAILFGPGKPIEVPFVLAKAECEAMIIARVWKMRTKGDASLLKVAVAGMLDKFAALAGVEVSSDGGESALGHYLISV